MFCLVLIFLFMLKTSLICLYIYIFTSRKNKFWLFVHMLTDVRILFFKKTQVTILRKSFLCCCMFTKHIYIFLFRPFCVIKHVRVWFDVHLRFLSLSFPGRLEKTNKQQGSRRIKIFIAPVSLLPYCTIWPLIVRKNDQMLMNIASYQKNVYQRITRWV